VCGTSCRSGHACWQYVVGKLAVKGCAGSSNQVCLRVLVTANSLIVVILPPIQQETLPPLLSLL